MTCANYISNLWKMCWHIGMRDLFFQRKQNVVVGTHILLSSCRPILINTLFSIGKMNLNSVPGAVVALSKTWGRNLKGSFSWGRNLTISGMPMGRNGICKSVSLAGYHGILVRKINKDVVGVRPKDGHTNGTRYLWTRYLWTRHQGILVSWKLYPNSFGDGKSSC